jgi:hypothetical protein
MSITISIVCWTHNLKKFVKADLRAIDNNYHQSSVQKALFYYSCLRPELGAFRILRRTYMKK